MSGSNPTSIVSTRSKVPAGLAYPRGLPFETSGQVRGPILNRLPSGPSCSSTQDHAHALTEPKVRLTFVQQHEALQRTRLFDTEQHPLGHECPGGNEGIGDTNQ